LKIEVTLAKFDTSKRPFTLMMIVIATITADSLIGIVADFIPVQLSSRSGVFVFILFAVLLAITQYLIIDYVKQSNKETRKRERAFHLQKLHTGVALAQYTIITIITTVILQVLFLQHYSTVFLFIIHAISYGLWIITLALLARAFFSWYVSSNKNLVALAMIAYVVSGMAALATSFDMLMQQKLVVTFNDVAYFPEFSIQSIGSQIGLVSQIASSAAYILTWVGTVKMLYPYVKKLGKIKFWIIMSAAMIYYLISFPLFDLGYFTPSENVDAMTNELIFSFAGIMSGIIFGAAFLSVARSLRKDSDLRNYMILAAYGFVLFYISESAMAA
jgi:hypothetical protein